jgi:ribonuclease HI
VTSLEIALKEYADDLRQLAEEMLLLPPETVRNAAGAAQVWTIARRLAQTYIDEHPAKKPTKPPATAGVVLTFDGACYPYNPGGLATYGWQLFNDNVLYAEGNGIAAYENTPLATCNVAEYAGLVAGLQHFSNSPLLWALEPPNNKLRIFGDSQLVIQQISGRWRCKKAHLERYRDYALSLLAGTPFTAEWRTRNDNDACDSLAQQAYDNWKAGNDMPALIIPEVKKPRGLLKNRT